MLCSLYIPWFNLVILYLEYLKQIQYWDLNQIQYWDWDWEGYKFSSQQSFSCTK